MFTIGAIRECRFHQILFFLSGLDTNSERGACLFTEIFKCIERIRLSEDWVVFQKGSELVRYELSSSLVKSMDKLFSKGLMEVPEIEMLPTFYSRHREMPKLKFYLKKWAKACKKIHPLSKQWVLDIASNDELSGEDGHLEDNNFGLNFSILEKVENVKVNDDESVEILGMFSSGMLPNLKRVEINIFAWKLETLDFLSHSSLVSTSGTFWPEFCSAVQYIGDRFGENGPSVYVDCKWCLRLDAACINAQSENLKQLHSMCGEYTKVYFLNCQSTSLPFVKGCNTDSLMAVRGDVTFMSIEQDISEHWQKYQKIASLFFNLEDVYFNHTPLCNINWMGNAKRMFLNIDEIETWQLNHYLPYSLQNLNVNVVNVSTMHKGQYEKWHIPSQLRLLSVKIKESSQHNAAKKQWHVKLASALLESCNWAGAFGMTELELIVFDDCHSFELEMGSFPNSISTLAIVSQGKLCTLRVREMPKWGLECAVRLKSVGLESCKILDDVNSVCLYKPCFFG